MSTRYWALLLSSCGRVLMPLSVLWGPLPVLSLSPNCYLFVSLGVSGSVHPYVRFSLSLSVCRALFLSLSLPWCLTPPLCLLVTLALRPLDWAHQPPWPPVPAPSPDLLVGSHRDIFSSEQHGNVLSLQGALS